MIIICTILFNGLLSMRNNMYTFIDDISDIVDVGFMNMPPVKRDGGKMACEECGGDYCEEELLSCGGCTTCYHTFCLIPQLPSLPGGTWFCPHCVAKVILICLSLHIFTCCIF